ncbi:nitrate reductase cytochrome c-type subunit [Arenicella sp. 4NH20-0111]|uniref:nitrate reductase cytochrome c-type subunit n=1 Tax=Arenicella sp. 4NH20-0111 TaxID=3127648 RepID=UPI003107B8DD
MNKLITAVFVSLSVLITSVVFAQNTATLRHGLSIDQDAEPDRMPVVQNDDIKRKRSYPMQPPTIPHKIDGYRVDTNSNKCLSCHSRNLSSDSQAPMVSVTHYMDRDGNFLASVSPRRYFCSQCHVVQTNAKPHVESDFVDLDDLLKAAQSKPKE